MKTLILLLTLVFNLSLAQMSRELCSNKTVYVTADAASFDEIKHQFMLISSLPYDVQMIKKEEKIAVIAITHLIDGQKPNAWEIQSRVRAILKDKIKKFNITNFTVNFSPMDTCK